MENDKCYFDQGYPRLYLPSRDGLSKLSKFESRKHGLGQLECRKHGLPYTPAEEAIEYFRTMIMNELHSVPELG